MARNFSVTEFKSNLQFGGARSTLFQVQLTAPPQLGLNIDLQKVPFLARAANIPASNIGLIPLPYFGRVVKMAGDRTFDSWTVTVINDEDFKIRNALETWSNSINQLRGNTRLGSAANLSYKAQAQVTHYSKTGDTLRTYNFEGLYPANISTIDLNWQNTDSIEEFQVTFEYDNWVVAPGGATGGPGNQG
jgi:hypothetical protein